MCTVYATANVSGGHLNPAVTFTTCLTGHMSWPRGGLYCVAQLLGAIFGALIAVRHVTGQILELICLSKYLLSVFCTCAAQCEPRVLA